MTDESGTVDDPVERFTSRVGAFVRHRPDYPEGLLDLLEKRHMIDVGTEVADIGAGTGILSEQLLDRGCEVWAIEPNESMRSVADATLGTRPMFHSVVGTAEDTSLDDDAVELVVAAQAFHWFDRDAARDEFERITEPPHRVALIWNVRDESAEIVEDLNDLIDEYAVDFEEVDYRRATERDNLNAFFGRGDAWARDSFDHSQTLRRAALQGLVGSWSYMPDQEHEAFEEMQEEVGELFDRHADGDEVELPYECKVFYGQFGKVHAG